MSANGGIAPKQTAWTRNAIRVQPVRYGLGGAAIGELAENALDYLGFFLADRALAGYRCTVWSMSADYVISIAIAAARESSLNATAQPAPRFRREILEEKLIHRALQADVEFADFAFGQCDDLYASETQTLIERGDICLITAQPIERLGQNGVELTCCGPFDEILESRPKHRRSGDRSISEGVYDMPALAVCSFPAQPDLVIDRGIALHLGGKPGIDCNKGHCLSRFIRLILAA
jgi:hypothetical protein